MSFLFLCGFIMVLRGQIPVEDFGTEVFGLWALFSIADALWLRWLLLLLRTEGR